MAEYEVWVRGEMYQDKPDGDGDYTVTIFSSEESEREEFNIYVNEKDIKDISLRESPYNDGDMFLVHCMSGPMVVIRKGGQWTSTEDNSARYPDHLVRRWTEGEMYKTERLIKG